MSINCLILAQLAQHEQSVIFFYMAELNEKIDLKKLYFQCAFSITSQACSKLNAQYKSVASSLATNCTKDPGS